MTRSMTLDINTANIILNFGATGEGWKKTPAGEKFIVHENYKVTPKIYLSNPQI